VPANWRPFQPAEGIISEGGRNSYIASWAGYALRQDGVTAADLPGLLALENNRVCRPPLDSRELEAIARSIGRYEVRHGR
jgi:hypothetical protein